ncbi:MAG TPA: endo-1,4-beta-xylanase, partial [Propionibacteriaceae bacterium]|nr:endo-1,4-beta-xylanase [Propionibacteriaceae bacterium]
MSLRRAFSTVLAGALAVASFAGLGTTADAARSPDPSTATLRQLARPIGLRIGTAVDTSALTDDSTYRRLVGQQFSNVTPENVMKWEVVEPARGQFDFTEADELVAFARAHNQKVRGHTLVWHNQLPSWLTSGTWTRAQLRAILRQHIFTEVGHFRGQIREWDVVNEAIDDNGELHDTFWLRNLGPGYIADAFRWAHQADPKAILFYNDYNIEGINAKSDAVYALVKQLKRQGVPIEGVGVQGHLSTRYGLPENMQQNLHRFAELGLKTAVTEADVRIDLPVEAAEVQAQSAAYSYMLESCLLERSCISFT